MLKTQLKLILKNRLMRFQFWGLVIMLGMFLFWSFSQKSKVMMELSESLRRGSEIHLQTQVHFINEQKNRELLDIEKHAIQEASAYLQSVKAYYDNDYLKYVQKTIRFWELRLLSREKYQSYLPPLDNLGANAIKQEQLAYKQAKQFLIEYKNLQDKENLSKYDLAQVTGKNVLEDWMAFRKPTIYYFPLLWTILLFLITPIFLDDSKHTTLLDIKPVHSRKYLFSKLFSYWLVSMFLVLIFFFIQIILTNVLFGIGDIYSPILIYKGSEEVLISQIKLVGLFFGFVGCILMFIVLLVGWINQLFSNKMLTFFVGLGAIWLEPLLQWTNISVRFADRLPFYYMSFGSVINGVKSDFYRIGNFTIEKGILSIVVSVMALFGLLNVTYLWKEMKKRRVR